MAVHVEAMKLYTPEARCEKGSTMTRHPDPPVPCQNKPSIDPVLVLLSQVRHVTSYIGKQFM